MHGKYTCTFFQIRLQEYRLTNLNVAREGFENLPSPKATITWCHVAQTLKKCFKNCPP